VKFFVPTETTITDSSIPNHTDENGTVYDTWVRTNAFQKDKIVSNEDKLYQAQTNVLKLATYIWNDYAEGQDPETIKLADDSIMPDPTAIPCVKDETIVYVQYSWKDTTNAVNGKYFRYTGTTGNVDFKAISPSSPSNFSEVVGFRHDILEPTGTTASIYWKYLGATNRNKCVDKSYNSQSVVASSTEEWWEFTAKNINRVVLFNVVATSATITLYTTDIESPIYTKTVSSLLDTSSIINWRTLSQFDPLNSYTKNADWTLPWFVGEVTIRITLNNHTDGNIKLGEILKGQEEKYGLTLDGVPTQIKSSGKIVELDNGDIILQDEGDITKIYLIFDFEIMFDTSNYDYVVNQSINKLINRRVVVRAEDGDGAVYDNLTIYGFIRDASPKLDSNSNKSKTKIQIQRFS
jgi:hypothetical protein